MSNTFKFQSFYERISNVNFDIFRNKTKHHDIFPLEENETYFSRELESSYLIDSSCRSFMDMYRRIKPYSMSLPLIVHHIHDIIPCLIEKLNDNNFQRPQSILRLLGILSRDTRDEFYPFFQSIIQTLIPKLDEWRTNSDLLESLFETISYLFKYLERFLIRDIEEFFNYYVDFIIHPKFYIREFSTESFSYLLRKLKMKKLSSMIIYMMDYLNKLRNDPNSNDIKIESYIESIGHLLFFSIKGIKGQFTTSMPSIFNIIVQIMTSNHNNNNDDYEYRYEIMDHMLKKMRFHLHHEDDKIIWKIIMKRIIDLSSNKEEEEENKDHFYGIISSMISTWIERRKLSKSKSYKTTLKYSTKCLEMILNNCDTKMRFIVKEKIIFGLLKTYIHFINDNRSLLGNKIKNYIEIGEEIIKKVNEMVEKDDNYMKLKFIYECINTYHFYSIYLKWIMEDMRDNDKENDDDFIKVIYYMNKIMKEMNWDDYEMINHSKMISNINIYGDKKVLDLIKDDKMVFKMTKFIKKILKSKLNDDKVEGYSILYMILRILSYIKLNDDDEENNIDETIKELNHYINNNDNKKNNFILSEFIGCRLRLIQNNYNDDEIISSMNDLFDDYIYYMNEYGYNTFIIRRCYEYFDYINSLSLSLSDERKDKLKSFMNDDNKIYKLLIDSLKDEYDMKRLNSLNLLYSLKMILKESSQIDDLLLQECIDIEKMEIDPLEHRKMSVSIELLEKFYHYKDQNQKISINFLFGTFFKRFPLVWPSTRKVLLKYCDNDYKFFWNILYNIFESYQRIIMKEENDNMMIINDEDEIIEESSSLPWVNDFYNESMIKGSSIPLTNQIKNIWDCIMDTQSYIPTSSKEVRKFIDLFIHYYEKYFSSLLSIDKEDENKEVIRLSKNRKKNKNRNRNGNDDNDNDDIITFNEMKSNLSKFLEFFSLFKTGGKGFFRSDELFIIFKDLLMMNHEKIQSFSVQCLFLWKYPYINKYKEELSSFVNSKTLRQSLMNHPIHSDQCFISIDHYKDTCEIIIRLLYPKISIQNSNLSLRNHILSYLSDIRKDGISFFFVLLFKNFRFILSNQKSIMMNNNAIHKSFNDPITLSPNIQIGLLNMIKDSFTKMIDHYQDYIDDVLTICLSLLINIIHFKKNNDSNDLMNKDQMNTIRKLSLKVITLFITNYYNHYDFKRYFDDIIYIITYEIDGLDQRISHNHNNMALYFIEKISSCGNSMNLLIKPFLLRVIKSLTIEKISNQIKSMIYSILENIMGIQSYNNDDENDGMDIEMIINDDNINDDDDILKEYSNDLLNSMHQRLIYDFKSNQKKSKFSIRELVIVSHCFKYSHTKESSFKMLSILFPYLSRETLSDDIKEQILIIYSRLIPSLSFDNNNNDDDDDIKQYINETIKLFEFMKTKNQRTLLCQIIEKIYDIIYNNNDNDNQLKTLIYHLYGINSYSDQFIDEPDYDRRIKSFSFINDGFFKSLSNDHIKLIIYNYLYFLCDDDISMRNSSSYGLSKIISFISESNNDNNIHSLVHNLLMKSLRRNLNSSKEKIRIESLIILSHIVKSFPSVYDDLFKCIHHDNDDDDDNNILLNIHHLQFQRRMKAMNDLNQYIDHIRYDHLMKIFYPILMRMMLEANKKMNNYIDLIIDSIENISKKMLWKDYYSSLRHVLSFMRRNKDLESQYIKLLIKIIESFHFDLNDEVDHEEDEEDDEEENVDKDKMNVEDDDDDDNDNEEKEGDDHISSKLIEEKEEQIKNYESSIQRKNNIISSLLHYVIPKLYSFLKIDDKRKETIRVPMAIAILHLYQRIPLPSIQYRIEKLILEVINTLSSRSQVIRDSGTSTLQKMVISLGVDYYFNFMINSLKSVLRRGYQLHILSSTINNLLKCIGDIINPGDIDHCVNTIIKDILIEELLGQTSEQKEVSKISSTYKEAKTFFIYDSILLLSKYIDFKKTSKSLIQPFIDILMETTSPVIIKRLTEIFTKISQGFKSNPSALFNDKVELIKELLGKYLEVVKEVKKLNSIQEKVLKNQRKFLIETEPRKLSQIKESLSSQTYNYHIILSFSLKMLHSSLKMNDLMIIKTIKEEEEGDDKSSKMINLLDPLVDILFKCCSSRFDTVIIHGMKCLCFILKYPLPSISNKSKNLTEMTIKLLKRSNPKSELIQMCFKVLIFIIREVKDYKIDDHSLSLMIDFIKTYIHDMDNMSNALQLLKVIIHKRFIIEEIYDIMKTINELLVLTRNNQIRLLCESIISQFLITYPLGGKRLEQNIEFMMTNINHDEKNGRLSIISLLSTIFRKFPSEVLHEHLELFYLPLVTYVINENDRECKENGIKSLEQFIQNINNDDRNKLFTMAYQWFINDQSKDNIINLSSQLIGIFIDKMGDNLIKQYSSKYLDDMIKRFNIIDNYQIIFDNYCHDTIIKSLLTLEKVISLRNNIMKGKSMIYILKMITDPLFLLNDKDINIRIISSRILSSYFSYIDENNIFDQYHQRYYQKGSNDKESVSFLFEERKLFKLSKLFCLQIENDMISEELGSYIEFNLFFTFLHVYKYPHLSPPHKKDDIEDIDVDDKDNQVERKGLPPYQWLMKRLSYMARRVEVLQRLIVLQFFLRTVDYLEEEDIKPLLLSMMNPLVRIHETMPSINVSHGVLEPHQQMTNKILNVIKKKVDNSYYIEVYESIRQSISKKRLERRSKEKREAVINPSLYAQRKIKKNEKKKLSKKRKMDKFIHHRKKVKIQKISE